MIRRILFSTLLAITVFGILAGASSPRYFAVYSGVERESSLNSYKLDSIINEAIDFNKSKYQAKDKSLLSSRFLLKSVASSAADWLVFTMARYGYEDDYTYYLGCVEQFISERNIVTEKMQKLVPTDWQRIALTVAAAGGNPQEIGFTKKKGYINLLDNAYYKLTPDIINKQGVNGWLWTLLTVGALNLPDKEGAALNKNLLLSNALGKQHADGGFGLGENSDADITCMMLTALSFFKDEVLSGSNNVSQSINRGLDYLSGIISDGGALSSYGADNAASTAWGVVCLSSLGLLTDNKFIKNEKSLLDGLMSFYLGDGSFSHKSGGTYDGRASEQALYALVAADRFYKGNPQLFDCASDPLATPILTDADKEAAQTLSKLPQNSGLFFITSKLYYLIYRADDYLNRDTELANVCHGLSLVIEIEQEIRSINSGIDNLLPIKKLTLKHKSKVNSLMRQTERLNIYDFNRLENYDDLVLAMKRMKSLELSTIVFVALIIAVIGAAIAVTLNSAKRRKLKREREE